MFFIELGWFFNIDIWVFGGLVYSFFRGRFVFRVLGLLQILFSFVARGLKRYYGNLLVLF